jgi:hypothetical protein
VDTSINAAATEQRLVGRVHNGINFELRNVALKCLYFGHKITPVCLALWAKAFRVAAAIAQPLPYRFLGGGEAGASFSVM